MGPPTEWHPRQALPALRQHCSVRSQTQQLERRADASKIQGHKVSRCRTVKRKSHLLCCTQKPCNILGCACKSFCITKLCPESKVDFSLEA
jgi:hypothetical protein